MHKLPLLAHDIEKMEMKSEPITFSNNNVITSVTTYRNYAKRIQRIKTDAHLQRLREQAARGKGDL